LHHPPLSRPYYRSLTVHHLFNLASGNRLWNRLLYSTAAYIVAFGSESYNSTGITSVDVECASGILKSLPASESHQWSDCTQEARQRRRVPVDGWPTYLSSFREVYRVIVYRQLLQSPGTPVKARGTIDRTFYELVFSIPGAFEDIANSSFNEIYKDLSGDLQDLLFASEEGEANFEEDTFYYVTRGAGRYTPKLLPCPLPITPAPIIQKLSLIHGSWTRSLSQSSRIQDLGDEDPLPNTAALTSRSRVSPIVPECRIFTADLRVEFNYDRAAWARSVAASYPQQQKCKSTIGCATRSRAYPQLITSFRWTPALRAASDCLRGALWKSKWPADSMNGLLQQQKCRSTI
jgi:hypothetical protein